MKARSVPKTIIVSNRLPVKITNNDGISTTPSEGGLATGLGSVYKEGNNLWIGWPGIVAKKKSQRNEITERLGEDNMAPVFLTAEEIKDFYEGFSNETLWPNFHYFNEYTKYDETKWKAYQKVNKKFCKRVAAYLEPGDKIWVHDYQLLLLPALLREKYSDLTIGFFQHIPFPSYETFRHIPWRRELLHGMLGADLLGFHTYDDMRHFLSAVNRISSLSNSHGQIDLADRIVKVDIFPMGIDYDKFANASTHEETLIRAQRYKSNLGEVKLILSIDRLDYSKGIPQRLKAFELFLNNHPEYIQKVSLLMLVVPSRDDIKKYQEIKDEIDLLVGRINGKFGKMNWTPVHYFYRSLPFHALSAFYVISDVALVTPVRDGMNLVCKEYIASQSDSKGVLILSEMAGASKELSDAILINPSDLNQMAQSIKIALEMPEDEQTQHISIMQKTLQKYNVFHWVQQFMQHLDEVKRNQSGLLTQPVIGKTVYQIISAYKQASKRLIFLDYDGTLVGFSKNPEEAVPTDDVLHILKSLVSDKKNRIVLISGRDQQTLDMWMGDLGIDIIGEHGIWIKKAGEKWETFIKLSDRWKPEILDMLTGYVNRTPGSFIEEKDYSLVWHYRRVETGLGELRTRELMSHLKYMVSDRDLQVLEGNKVVEIKNSQINKGVAATRWMQEFPSDFNMAIGDDWTDEDTFKALPNDAYTIKVGGGISSAKFGITDYLKVRELLSKLAEN